MKRKGIGWSLGALSLMIGLLIAAWVTLQAVLGRAMHGFRCPVPPLRVN